MKQPRYGDYEGVQADTDLSALKRERDKLERQRVQAKVAGALRKVVKLGRQIDKNLQAQLAISEQMAKYYQEKPGHCL